MSKQGVQLSHKVPRSSQTNQDATSSAATPMASSSVKSAFEGLIAAARTLSSDESVEYILSHFEKIPELGAMLKSKDAEIKRLKIEMTDKEATHNATHHQSLSIYEDAKEKLKSQLEKSEAKIKELTRHSETNVAHMEELKGVLRRQQEQFSQSETALKKWKAESESLTKQHLSVSRQLEDMRNLMMSLSDEDPVPT